MNTLIGLLLLGGGFVFGMFSLSQIIYPLFYSMPRAKRLEREGALIKPIPLNYFFIAPMTWGCILFASIWLVSTFSPNYINLYLTTIAGTCVIVIAQLIKKNPDLEEDFNDTMGRFLKENTEKGINSEHSSFSDWLIDDMKIQDAIQIVKAYGGALGRTDKDDIARCASKLPCSKSRIRQAYHTYLSELSKYTDHHDDMAQKLVVTYAALSSFINDDEASIINDIQKRQLGIIDGIVTDEEREKYSNFINKNLCSTEDMTEIMEYFEECKNFNLKNQQF